MTTKKNEITIRSSEAEYLTYIAATGDTPESYEMRYEDENIWLTQKMMAALQAVDVANINYHLKKIYDDGELTKEATIKNFLILQTEGVRQVSREVAHYNLQMIIAVGFKVNNCEATYCSSAGDGALSAGVTLFPHANGLRARCNFLL